MPSSILTRLCAEGRPGDPMPRFHVRVFRRQDVLTSPHPPRRNSDAVGTFTLAPTVPQCGQSVDTSCTVTPARALSGVAPSHFLQGQRPV